MVSVMAGGEQVGSELIENVIGWDIAVNFGMSADRSRETNVTDPYYGSMTVFCGNDVSA